MTKDPAEERSPAALDTLAAFFAAVLLAGGNAPAIRYVSCKTCELDPFWAAAMRFFLASLLLGVIAGVMRVPMLGARSLRGPILFGVLQFGAGFGLVYWALVRVPAGLGQVLIACVPLITLGLAVVQRQESFRFDRLVGGLISVAGIGVVFGAGQASGIPSGSMIAILGGSTCWAEALIVVKRFPPVHPVVMNTIGMAVGAIILLLVALVSGESIEVPHEASTWLAQAYLVVAGSIVVFWLYVLIVARWSASAAAYQLVVIPVITVPVSAWLQDEQITTSFVLGSALVLCGVYVGALRRPEPVE